MGTCPVVKAILANLTRLDRVNINNPAEILFAFPNPNAKMGTRHSMPCGDKLGNLLSTLLLN
jgi:hypothetical protein